MSNKNYQVAKRIINGKDAWVQGEFDELFKEYQQTKSRGLINDLIAAHRPLAVLQAGRYSSLASALGIDTEDLVTYGCMGLFLCIRDHYDPNMKGRNLKSYAGFYIWRQIQRGVSELSNIPQYKISQFRRLDKAAEDYKKQTGAMPNLEQLSEATHLPLATVKSLSRHLSQISFDSEFDDGSPRFKAYMADPKNPNPLDALVEKETVGMLLKKAHLTPKELELLYERFGLNGEGERTYKEIGEEYGVRGETIRQRIVRIINKIRRANDIELAKP